MKKRQRILRRDPLCRICKVSLSTEVDHIIPTTTHGGSDDDENLQGLCAPCHKMKSRAETHRGDH
jgi:5-methylcytosine-specific restriction enzyme A